VIILDMPQYSPEWWAARCGLPSASRASEILTALGKPSASRFPYMAELISDLMGYADDEQIDTEWTRRGTLLEDDARMWLEMREECNVKQVGLILNDDQTACCSPDGLLLDGDDIRMGVEIKVPMPKTHIGYLIKGELPPAYKQQVHFSMAVSGIRDWLFISYHPEIQPFEKLVTWDDYTEKMAEALALFIEQLADAKEQII
jgi:hypothetical protein